MNNPDSPQHRNEATLGTCREIKASTSRTGATPIRRTSITLSEETYRTGQTIAARRGFGQSFSAYLAWLIQRDAEGGVTREDAHEPVAPALPEAGKRKRRKPAR